MCLTSLSVCLIAWSVRARATVATGLFAIRSFTAGFTHSAAARNSPTRSPPLHAVIEPYMRIWFDYIDKPLSAREEHAALIVALRSGDVQHTEQVMRDHILGTAPMLADFASPNRR
jgi:DNA-binding GntR family transcriptional regulator